MYDFVCRLSIPEAPMPKRCFYFKKPCGKPHGLKFDGTVLPRFSERNGAGPAFAVVALSGHGSRNPALVDDDFQISAFSALVAARSHAQKTAGRLTLTALAHFLDVFCR